MARINWTPSEEDYIIAHRADGASAIAQYLGRSENSVRGRIGLLVRRGRLTYESANAVTTEQRYGADVVAFIRANYVRYGSRYCMDKLGVTLRTVRNVAAALGLKLTRESGRALFAYDFEEKVLTAPTREFAYFLGFFWGDGYLQGRAGSGLAVQCVESDLIQLAPIFEMFGHWKRESGIPKRGDGVVRKRRLTLTLCSMQLREFLEARGYSEKKRASADEILLWLPANLRHYWWRGYFDADGHVHFSSDGIYAQRCQVSLASCYEQDWTFAKRLLAEQSIGPYDVERRTHKTHANHRDSCIVIQQQEPALKFLEFLYRDYDYIGLGRKFMVYMDLKRYMTFKANNPYLYGTGRSLMTNAA